MKGVVFTEFLEMVEQEFDVDTVDDIIDAADLPSKGAYTSVGTYPFEELAKLITILAEQKDVPATTLIFNFGTFLAQSFAKKFPSFFEEEKDTLSFLIRIDQHIHVEVQKLYPDAELPKFTHERIDENTLILHYKSVRNLPDLAHGLIIGVSRHYNETLDISREQDSTTEPPTETFTVRKI